MARMRQRHDENHYFRYLRRSYRIQISASQERRSHCHSAVWNGEIAQRSNPTARPRKKTGGVTTHTNKIDLNKEKFLELALGFGGSEYARNSPGN